MSDSPNSLTLGSDYVIFSSFPVSILFVLLLCHIIIECCSLVCHEKSGCIFLISASLISSIGEKCHNRPQHQYDFAIFFCNTFFGHIMYIKLTSNLSSVK